MPKRIYFDSVSSTPLNEEILANYKSLLDQHYANSDALYDEGVASFKMQEASRHKCAELLGVDAAEIIFTSGASEANNLAIKGLAFKHGKGHIITSYYEHSSVYEALKQLELLGYELTYLMPDKEGKISVDSVKENIKEDTFLVSIMWVNNEIGTINDVEGIGLMLKQYRNIAFHCDITQGITKLDIDLTNIDLASFSAHKLHGLKGSGALIKKKHISLLPLISGGQQEFGLRGGTSNALVNALLAKTLRLAMADKEGKYQYVTGLHDYFLSLIDFNLVKLYSPADHLPYLVCLGTPLTSEVMLNALNLRGIMVSSKSTCGSRKAEVSRSIKALGYDDDYSLRISFDCANTREEVAYLWQCMKESIEAYGRI